MASESIYNWIKEDVQAAAKPPMYRSKHKADAPVPASTFRKEKRVVGTFGRIVKDKVDPKKYLKGRERCGRGVQPTSKPKRFTRKDKPRKAAVPSRHERPVMGVKHEKDFVTANAVENILAVPPARTKKQELRYTQKAEYGRPPAYLETVKADVEAERDFIRQMLDEQDMVAQAEQPRMRQMPEDERAEMLDALKEKWDAVNMEYQKITFKNISTSNSTIGQIRAKEACEQQLAQLERDIKRLSAKGPIYVLDDE